MSTFLDVAIAAVEDAETVIRKYYDPKGIDSTKKSDGSPVTIADKESEAAIIARIKASFPGHSIFGEETGVEDNASEYYWVIDPIDGTKNFTRGLPYFGTLIALMKNGEVIVGVSNMPMISERIWAEKGSGAFLNGKPLQTSSVTSLKDTYVSVGGLKYFADLGLADKLIHARDHVFQLRMIGDCYMYHLLVQSNIDAAVEADIKLYDVAPFKLIVEEAGGRVTEMDGSEVGKESRTLLATNGHIHSDLVDYFKE